MTRITKEELTKLQDHGHNHHIFAHYDCGHTSTCRCMAEKVAYSVDGICPSCEFSKSACEKKTILVDFDGVLHKYSKGWNDGTIYDGPVEGAKDGMQKLKNKGHELVIFSTRAADSKQIPAMKAWLKKHDIPYDSIYEGKGKPPHDLIIDDNAVRFEGDWMSMKKEIGEKLACQAFDMRAELQHSEIDTLLQG